MTINNRATWRRRAIALIAAFLALAAIVFVAPSASTQLNDGGAAPAGVSSGGPAWQAPHVDQRSNQFPIYGAWKYQSTVNNRTYYLPGAEFCVFDASNDNKIGCTYTNNRPFLSDQAKVLVPRLGSYYVSLNGAIARRDRPLKIPWTIDGTLNYWERATFNGVTCFGQRPTYIGTPANENVRGTQGRDIYYMANGDDTVRGLGGNDLLCGGNGNDLLIGGDGVDRLGGDSGNDILRGDAGNDILIGHGGRDILIGGPGTDQCRGANDIKRSC